MDTSVSHSILLQISHRFSNEADDQELSLLTDGTSQEQADSVFSARLESQYLNVGTSISGSIIAMGLAYRFSLSSPCSHVQV